MRWVILLLMAAVAAAQTPSETRIADEVLSRTRAALAAIQAWDVEIFLQDPKSPSGTVVMRSAGRGDLLRRFEASNEIAIQDAKTLWILDRSKNEYRRSEPDPARFNGQGPGWFTNPVAAFGQIASEVRQEGPARLEMTRVRGAGVRCWILDVIYSSPAPKKERWYVAADSFLLQRVESDQSKLEFIWRSVNQPVPDDVFRFAPPAGAREVPR
jgi:outer membrane lipoprotein-sorting protein